MAYNPNIHHRKSIRLKGYDYSQAGLYFITICTQNRACLFGEIRGGQMVLNDAGKMVNHWYYELQNKYNDIKCHAMVVMPNHFHCIVENVGGNVGADLRVCPHNTNERDNTGDPNNTGTPVNMGEHVGSPLRVCPHNTNERDNTGDPNNAGTPVNMGEHVGSPLRVCPHNTNERDNMGDPNNTGTPVNMGEHVGSPLRICPNDTGERTGSPIQNVVQWFKTMTTNHYIRGVKQNNWPPFYGKLWQRNYWEHIIRNQNEYQRITQYIINNPQQWENDKLFM